MHKLNGVSVSKVLMWCKKLPIMTSRKMIRVRSCDCVKNLYLHFRKI